MKVIDRFEGPNAFLSNFYPSIIRIPNADWTYPTVEHFFQAHKTPMGSPAHTHIMDADTPAIAKKLGRKLNIRQDWDEVKVGIMFVALRYKFKMHDRLTDMLRGTGEAYLIEGNTWGDRFWGQVDGEGRNVLGTLLMIIRQEISRGRTSGGFKSAYIREP